MTECAHSRPGEKVVGAALRMTLMSAGGGRRDIPAGGVPEQKLASLGCVWSLVEGPVQLGAERFCVYNLTFDILGFYGVEITLKRLF